MIPEKVIAELTRIQRNQRPANCPAGHTCDVMVPVRELIATVRRLLQAMTWDDLAAVNEKFERLSRLEKESPSKGAHLIELAKLYALDFQVGCKAPPCDTVTCEVGGTTRCSSERAYWLYVYWSHAQKTMDYLRNGKPKVTVRDKKGMITSMDEEEWNAMQTLGEEKAAGGDPRHTIRRNLAFL